MPWAASQGFGLARLLDEEQSADMLLRRSHTLSHSKGDTRALGES